MTLPLCCLRCCAGPLASAKPQAVQTCFLAIRTIQRRNQFLPGWHVPVGQGIGFLLVFWLRAGFRLLEFLDGLFIFPAVLGIRFDRLRGFLATTPGRLTATAGTTLTRFTSRLCRSPWFLHGRFGFRFLCFRGSFAFRLVGSAASASSSSAAASA